MLITIIAIQLLASCFTLSQGLSAYSSQSTSYNSGGYADATSFDPRLVSSLRLDTQYQHSPALGHYGRDVSVALPWPETNMGLSHERYHTRATARHKKRRPDKGIKDIVSGDGEGGYKREQSTSHEGNIGRWFQSCGDEESINISPDIPVCGRRKDRIFGRPRRFVGSPPTELSPSAMTEFGSSVLSPEYSRADHIEMQDEGHRWSFQPILRSEAHPVFVQPVKEYVIRRWRHSSSKPMSDSSSSSLGVRKTGHGTRRNSGAELIAETLVSAHSRQAKLSSDSETSLLDIYSATFVVAKPCVKSKKLASTGHYKSPLHSPPLVTKHRRSYSERNSIEESKAPISFFPPYRAHRPIPLRIFRFSDNGPERTSSSGTSVLSPRVAADAWENDTKSHRKGRHSSGSSSCTEPVEMRFL